MSDRRIAKKTGTFYATVGATAQTEGIQFQSDIISGIRTATIAATPVCSPDGTLTNHLADGYFGQKTIVDGSATSLFDVAVPSGDRSGGVVFFLVEATDGTDHQADSAFASYSAVNKAGTVTAAVTYATANEAKSVSAGTLTLAFTNVAGTAKCTVKLQPTGSLTETAPYRIVYFVLPIRGAVTIL